MTFHAPIDPDVKADIVKRALEHTENGLSLLSFCEDNGLNYSSVYRWIEEQAGEDSSLTRARTIGTHALADKCLKELDGVTPENYQAVKTKVDGYLRLAGKWNRKEYGEQVQVDGTMLHKPDLSQLSDSSLQELMQLPAFQNLALPAPKG